MTVVKARTVVALLLLALVAAGCRGSSDTETGTATEGNQSSDEGTASGDFGSLSDVCQSGDASGATAQGVTDDTIQLGTLTDFGFTKNREFIDAAEVFTQWCNAAGGINGRKLEFQVRDAQLFQYRQQVLQSCREDFLLVGGGAAFDNTGVKDRLKCLLPEFPAQVVSYENTASDLQVNALGENPQISPYEGYYKWLVKEKYPQTADAIGIIAGDIGITRLFSQRETEALKSLGAKIVYSDVYPASGASDWTPYAQALKDAKVKGLIWFGDFTQLSKLEQSLTDIGFTPEWIDANSNSYNQQFLKLTSGLVGKQTNFAPLQIFPLEQAADNEATQQLLDVYKEYAPDVTLTGPAVQAFSAWLLFAQSAAGCGDDLTRSCVYDAAMKVTEWDGGGLHATTNPSDSTDRTVCFHAVTATAAGWESADFGANDGAYRCEEHQHTLTGDYPKATTLEDVGLSIDDLE